MVQDRGVVTKEELTGNHTYNIHPMKNTSRSNLQWLMVTSVSGAYCKW